jgi:hypothetical protein
MENNTPKPFFSPTIGLSRFGYGEWSPADAVPITEQQFNDLLREQVVNGKTIAVNKSGLVEAIDKLFTVAELVHQAKTFLQKTDYKDLPNYQPKEGEDLAKVIADRDIARNYVRVNSI